MNSHRLLLNADEVAAMLGLKRGQVYTLVRGNLIPAVHVGRKVMFSLRSLEAWIENGCTPIGEYQQKGA